MTHHVLNFILRECIIYVFFVNEALNLADVSRKIKITFLQLFFFQKTKKNYVKNNIKLKLGQIYNSVICFQTFNYNIITRFFTPITLVIHVSLQRNVKLI